MKIKRVVQGTALAALAAAAWMGAGSTDASAAEFPKDNVSISDNGTALEVGFDDPELMVSMLKVGKGKTDVKITSWDVYEGNSATIDLSKLKATSDNYIALKTDNSDPIVLHIEASGSKYKAKYNAKDQKIVFTEDAASASRKVGLQYRTAYTDWDDITNKDDAFGGEFQYQGATIYLRERSDLHSATSTEAKLNDVTIKDKPVEMKVYDIGALPGKEIKFNIAAQAKGPSVKADYTKGVVKIKEGLEWRFVGSSIGTTSAAVATDGKVGKLVDEIVTSGTEGVLEVRTAAKGEGEKSKAPSKWTRIKVQKLTNLAGPTGDLSTLTTGGATSSVDILAITGGSINAKYEYDAKKDTVKSVIIKNGSTAADIEYIIGTEIPKVADKAKKLKAGKEVKIKAADAKNKLYIRVAGDNKKQDWVTNYVEAGTFGTIK